MTKVEYMMYLIAYYQILSDWKATIIEFIKNYKTDKSFYKKQQKHSFSIGQNI